MRGMLDSDRNSSKDSDRSKGSEPNWSKGSDRNLSKTSVDLRYDSQDPVEPAPARPEAAPDVEAPRQKVLQMLIPQNEGSLYVDLPPPEGVLDVDS